MKKAIEVQAPNVIQKNTENLKKVFLAGSIELGQADEWQKRIINELSDLPIIFLNPRRDDWDASWNEDNNKDLLVEQIIWELTSLEISDIIILYFDPKTKSPISLLEIGLHARGKRLIVLCPNGFWKKTNVDVTCEFYGIDQVDTFEELINSVKNKI